MFSPAFFEEELSKSVTRKVPVYRTHVHGAFYEFQRNAYGV
jgi:hypothetical protein